MTLNIKAENLAAQLGRLLRRYVETDGTAHEAMAVLEAFQTGFKGEQAKVAYLDLPLAPVEPDDVDMARDPRYGRFVIEARKFDLDAPGGLILTITPNQVIVEPAQQKVNGFERRRSRVILTMADDGKSCIVHTIDRTGNEDRKEL